MHAQILGLTPVKFQITSEKTTSFKYDRTPKHNEFVAKSRFWDAQVFV